jgi:CHAT domain-containing protein
VVGQPNEGLSGVKEELEVIRAVEISVTGLVSDGATRATVIQDLQEHQLVHFVCHGTLRTGKPFDAGLELHDGDRLTLLDIVRSRLSVTEFAFLSACHTAEMTDVENPDEALHLTAAMQYSGFCSVVGTMWAMVDTDGPNLSQRFYKAMVETMTGLCVSGLHRLYGVRYRNCGVRGGLPWKRWVNFDHYGV